MKTIFVDAIECFVSKDGEIFKEMHELLESYPNKKVILTSADAEQFEKFGLHKMPYPVFTLKHDPEKTDPAYYVKVLEFFRISAEDALYFEHDLEAVKSAQSVGIKTHHFNKGLPALKTFLDRKTPLAKPLNFYQKIKRFWHSLFWPPRAKKMGKKKKVRSVPAPILLSKPAFQQPRSHIIRKCIATQKFMFTREQAGKKKDELLRRGTAPYLRIYLCQFCDHWHLTHKKDLMKKS